MATHTVNADDSGGYDDAYFINMTSDITNSRNATSSGSRNSTSNTYHFCMVGKAFSNYSVGRTTLAFDINTAVSGGAIPSGATIDSIELQINLESNVRGFFSLENWGNTHGAKYDLSAGNFTSHSAYSRFVGRTSTGSYSGNVTEYFTAFSNSAGAKAIALNATAISDAQTIVNADGSADPEVLAITLINSADFSDSGYPTFSGMIDYKGAFITTMENATSANRPKIEITYTEGGVTHNAIIFGTNF